jgi:hypothetical protein
MTILTKATGIFTFISILFFAGSAQSQISDSIYTIQKGTKIRVRMDNEINSKVSSVGDTFTTTISAPVIIRGIEVLPVGTVIEGKVIRVKNASFAKSDGNFEVNFETLYLPNGVKRQIEASLVSLDKSKSSQIINIVTIGGASAIGALLGSFLEKTKGAIVGAGIGLGLGTGVVLLQKGKEARIKAGQEVSILLKREVTLPPQDY